MAVCAYGRQGGIQTTNIADVTMAKQFPDQSGFFAVVEVAQKFPFDNSAII